MIATEHRHKWSEWRGVVICIVCGIRKIDWYATLEAELALQYKQDNKDSATHYNKKEV